MRTVMLHKLNVACNCCAYLIVYARVIINRYEPNQKPNTRVVFSLHATASNTSEISWVWFFHYLPNKPPPMVIWLFLVSSLSTLAVTVGRWGVTWPAVQIGLVNSFCYLLLLHEPTNNAVHCFVHALDHSLRLGMIR